MRSDPTVDYLIEQIVMMVMMFVDYDSDLKVLQDLLVNDHVEMGHTSRMTIPMYNENEKIVDIFAKESLDRINVPSFESFVESLYPFYRQGLTNVHFLFSPMKLFFSIPRILFLKL
jgi:hypothetical protein